MQLNLPARDFKLKKEKETIFIFDELRRKYVTLTPEEWVRQNFVAFLINDKGFPAGLMGNEISLEQNGIKRRCDTLIADKYGAPFVIVEYKAPFITITQSVFDQIARYNMVMRAKYLIVSNGMQHFCCHVDYEANSYQFLKNIPDFNEL